MFCVRDLGNKVGTYSCDYRARSGRIANPWSGNVGRTSLGGIECQVF